MVGSCWEIGSCGEGKGFPRRREERKREENCCKYSSTFHHTVLLVVFAVATAAALGLLQVEIMNQVDQED